MQSLQQFLTVFFSFKAYVMLPIIIFLIALVVRLPMRQVVLSTVSLAAGLYLISSTNTGVCTLEPVPPVTYTWDGSTNDWTNAVSWVGGLPGGLPANGSTGIIASV